MKSGYDLENPNSPDLTNALFAELRKDEVIKESRILTFDAYSGISEAFNIEAATKTASSQPAAKKFKYDPSKEAGPAKPKLLYKKGDTGNVVVAINRIVGQTADEKNYTDDTVERVKAFQKLNGKHVDGLAGEDTLRGLYDTRNGAETPNKLNDPKAPRGQAAYKILADLLKEKYTAKANETEGILTDSDLLGETSGLSSFINTILPAAKYVAFIGIPGISTAIIGTAIDALKERRTGVKGVVDAIDGFVKESDLLYVLTVLQALKGKKMKDGTSAIERFKKLYKMDEGEDLVEDIESVGTKTMSVKGDLIKEEILKLLGK
jgi:hypothetical protein